VLGVGVDMQGEVMEVVGDIEAKHKRKETSYQQARA